MMGLFTGEIEEPYVLLVEGPGDEYFFRALARHMQLERVQVVLSSGKDDYWDKVKSVRDASGFGKVAESLGLVRDANNDARAAFQSACDALGAAGLPVPKRQGKAVEGEKRVAVVIVPGKNKRGRLEDLCLASAEEEPAMECVDSYFECLQKQGVSVPRIESKARVQVYLASKRETDKRLGIGAERGYWDWESPVFKGVKDFLRELCAVEEVS